MPYVTLSYPNVDLYCSKAEKPTFVDLLVVWFGLVVMWLSFDFDNNCTEGWLVVGVIMCNIISMSNP